MKTCCSLRSWGIAIAVIELIFCSLAVILLCVSLIVFVIPAEISARHAEKIPTAHLHESLNAAHKNTTRSHSERELHLASLLMKSSIHSLEFITIFCIVNIIVASILLYGIRKGSLPFLQVWLIFKIVFIPIGIMLTAIHLCIWGVSTRYIVCNILGQLMSFCFMKVIYELRKEIKESNGQFAYSKDTFKA